MKQAEYQISLFDGDHKLTIDKPIRLIELFAGYGSQALALKYLGANFEHWKICEWAVKSIQAYKDLHFGDDNTDYSAAKTQDEVIDYLYNKGISANYNEPMTIDQIKRLGEEKQRVIYNNLIATHNLVSVCNCHASDLEISDTDKYTYIMTYSFPCFTADSLVLTDNGYKPINEIKIGDMVLTCDNTYQRVNKTFDNGIKPILKINAMAVDEIKCTNNHRFYVRTMSRVGHNQHRVFSNPYWKPACTLTKKDYLGIAINQKSIIPMWNGVDFEWSDGRKTRHKNQLQGLFEFADFWWIIGRYMGDGWSRAQGGIIICCAHDELDEVTRRIDKLFNYNVAKERTVYKIHIPIKELSAFVAQFGSGAMNKHLTNTILDLPTNLLKAFLNGYMSADGCCVNGLNKVTSTSRELIYGIAQCVAKVYRTPYRVYCTKRPKKCIIEGRVVNQHNSYELVWKNHICKQDKAFFEDGFIWFPISKISEDIAQNVYDIEVENNHSFTVQNTIVHNCQDLSLAGKGLGMEKGSGTRSGLLWEVERILDECNGNLPQILLMENVPEVIGTNNSEHFSQWVAKLDSLGYKSKWEILNAKDYGVPQNRARCFMVSWLGNYYYDFPKKVKLEKRIKDILETNVDEKYYLNDDTIERISKWKSQQQPLDHILNDNSCSPCLTARGGGEEHSGMILYGETNDNNRFFKQAFETAQENDCNAGDTIDAYNKKVNQSGTSPTITTRPEGFKTAILVVDGFNQSIRADQTCFGTITRNVGADLKRNGQGLIEIEPLALDEQNGYIRQDGTVGTLTTDGSSPKHNNRIIEKNLRIRKITPKECGRLMGVRDKDIDTMAVNQNNSSQYHLYGDSIVVDVLMAIFGQML